ncbi:MAG: GNAT family N-acetyltransferase [Pseudonocardiaceae bacterium]|nr:GNAT family N-acetyltransferase [Pseudonocardiaceae bacterium]
MPAPELAVEAEAVVAPCQDPPGWRIERRDADELLGEAVVTTPVQGIGLLSWISVEPAAQGRGLARPLLGRALEVLSDHGACEVILYVDDDKPRRRARPHGRQPALRHQWLHRGRPAAFLHQTSPVGTRYRPGTLAPASSAPASHASTARTVIFVPTSRAARSARGSSNLPLPTVQHGSELWNAEPEGFVQAAQRWEAFGAALGKRHGELLRVITAVGAQWEGVARDAAIAHLNGLADRVERDRGRVEQIGPVLAQHADAG